MLLLFMKRLKILIIGIAFFAVVQGWIAHSISDKNADVFNLDLYVRPASKAEKVEPDKQDLAIEYYTEHEQELGPLIKPVCAPEYDKVCILNEAISLVEKNNPHSDDGFKLLSRLLNTAIKIEDQATIRRLISVLENDTARKALKDINLYLALMKAHIAVNEFETAYNLMMAQKGSRERYSFSQFPPSLAIRLFTKKDAINYANKAVFVSLTWTAEKAPPPIGCFGGGGSYADVLLPLIQKNLTQEDYKTVEKLVNLITEEGSHYYDPNRISFITRRFATYFRENPEAQKPSKEWCSKLTNLRKRDDITMRMANPYFMMELHDIGCKEEQAALVKDLYDVLQENEKLKSNIYHSGLVYMVAGEYDELIDEISKIEEPYKRFGRYLQVAQQAHRYAYPELQILAEQNALSVYESIDIEARIKNRGYEREWLSYYTKTGQKEKADEKLDKILADIKNYKRTEFVRSWVKNHRPERYEEVDSILPREGLYKDTNPGQTIINLTGFDMIDDALEVYDGLKPSQRRVMYADRILNSMFENDYTGPDFERLWSDFMRGCLVRNISRNLDDVHNNEHMAANCMNIAIN